MLSFLLWLILLVMFWPLALAALVLYPVVWLLLLPFRILGIAVDGVLSLIWAIVTLPARLLGGKATQLLTAVFARFYAWEQLKRVARGVAGPDVVRVVWPSFRDHTPAVPVTRVSRGH